VPTDTITINSTDIPKEYTPNLHKDRGLVNWLWPRVPLKGTTFGGETSAKQVFHRLAGCWTYWGWRSRLLTTEDDIQHFYDECYMMLAMQIGAPNSPQWFNTGLHWAYGIEGPESGQWYVDYNEDLPASGEIKPSSNSYEHPQPHACFIQPVNDDLVNPGGIMDLWTREVRLFKYGSGTGTNFSPIRALGEILSGGGVSSGLMSFLRIGDRAAGAIKSGGTTRRAAKMVVLNADHPEIEEFIDWKMHEEEKAAAISIGSQVMRDTYRDGHCEDNMVIPQPMLDRMKNGYEPNLYPLNFECEPLDTVSGQNSNNSVRLTNAFIKSVEKDHPWNLKWRTNGKVAKTVMARDLWDKICRAAWACADPGLQFDTTMNEWHTCLNDGRINATNPCSEYCFLDNTACNLASLNLCCFPEEDEGFDYDGYEHAVRLWTIVLDISVQMASFPSKEIAQGSYNYRTLGLGYANLGGLLMQRGIPYNSKEGRALAAGLTALMTGISYKTSAEMAGEVGPFPRWEANQESMYRVLHNHRAAATGNKGEFQQLSITPYLAGPANDRLQTRLDRVWAEVVKCQSFRNAQVTLIAPTGTISFVMDCDTTGIEPDFALVKHKNLAGGGSMQITNQSVSIALKRLGYADGNIDRITKLMEHGTPPSISGIKGEHLEVFECANTITPMAHVRMVAAVQPFLSGAVSKTINMPNNAQIEDVSTVYLESHRLGLKAVALYRDGSKLNQPLQAAQLAYAAVPAKPNGHNPPFRAPIRELLPWRRDRTWLQKVKIDGNSVYLHVSEYEDGRPGEIFLELAHQGSTLRAMGNLFAIAVSIGLQHGIPIEQFIKNFLHTKFEPAGMVEGHAHIKMVSSIADYLARELAITYCDRMDLANVKPEAEQLVPTAAVIADTTSAELFSSESMTTVYARQMITGDICPECNNATLRRTGTCVTCSNCSFNTGCG
jgi:adenosylcobalamin-dependent ribonucleoside-diphosphate reductase